MVTLNHPILQAPTLTSHLPPSHPHPHLNILPPTLPLPLHILPHSSTLTLHILPPNSSLSLNEQVSCYTSGCPAATYPSSPSTFSGSTKPLQLVIQDITTLCLPCDRLCASCTGPGNTSCTTCRYARRLAQCVSGCDNATGKPLVLVSFISLATALYPIHTCLGS